MTALSLCLFGNSHLAALKAAWDAHQAEFGQTTIKFFGAPGPRIGCLEVIEGKAVIPDPAIASMVKEVSGGDDSVSLQDHDAFVFIGLGLGFRIVLLSLHSHLATEEFKTSRLQQELISEACLVQCINDLIMDTTAIQLLKKIRAATDKPVYLCTEPYLSESALNQSEMRHLPPLQQSGALGRIKKLYARCLKKILTELNVVWIQQPEQTIRPPCFTKLKFSRGSTALMKGDRKHPKADVRHMNKTYGLQMLTAISAHITADRETKVG